MPRYAGVVRAGPIVPLVENQLTDLGLPTAPYSLKLVPEPSALLLLLLAASLLGTRNRPSVIPKAR